MRVIPVLDLRHGQAVRAVAGDRAHYGPLRSVLHDGTDPIYLARAGRDHWGLPDLYLADLDAILGESAPNFELYRKLADLGLTLWIDAGVQEASDIPRLVEAGVGRVIVGLETVRGPDALAEIMAEFGPNRIVFSLDVRGISPMVDSSTRWGTDRPQEIAELVVEIGIRRLIYLDLELVGTGRNPRLVGRGNLLYWLADLALGDHIGLEWLVGGGITKPDELKILGRIGAWGALIGSALHDGRLTVEDLKNLPPRWPDCAHQTY